MYTFKLNHFIYFLFNYIERKKEEERKKERKKEKEKEERKKENSSTSYQ